MSRPDPRPSRRSPSVSSPLPVTAGLAVLLTLMVLAPLAAEVRTSRLMGAAPMALAHHAERQIEPPPPAPRCGHHVASIDARPLDLGADRAPAAWRTLDLPPPGQV